MRLQKERGAKRHLIRRKEGKRSNREKRREGV
jgi:hypothetical protein